MRTVAAIVLAICGLPYVAIGLLFWKVIGR